MEVRKTKLDRLVELMVLIMLGVILNVFDMALAVLPNIEVITLLIMVYTHKFGIKALIPTYVYVFLEILLNGINLWVIMYLYVWAMLVLMALPFVRLKSQRIAVVVLTVIAGLFGLLFGTLCAIPYIFMFDLTYAVSWVVSGLPFDIIHAVSNVITVGVLYIPLIRTMDRIKI